MPGAAGRRGRAHRLRDAAPDRMSAADWPGQNSSPEAEIGRQEAATSSRQTTLSAAMAPAATHFRLPRPAPEARLSAPRSASPVATATRPGPRCARASRRPEHGVCGRVRGRARGWGLEWAGPQCSPALRVVLSPELALRWPGPAESQLDPRAGRIRLVSSRTC